MYIVNILISLKLIITPLLFRIHKQTSQENFIFYDPLTSSIKVPVFAVYCEF